MKIFPASPELLRETLVFKFCRDVVKLLSVIF